MTPDVDAKAGGHSEVRGRHLTTRSEELYFLVRPDPPLWWPQGTQIHSWHLDGLHFGKKGGGRGRTLGSMRSLDLTGSKFKTVETETSQFAKWNTWLLSIGKGPWGQDELRYKHKDEWYIFCTSNTQLSSSCIYRRFKYKRGALRAAAHEKREEEGTQGLRPQGLQIQVWGFLHWGAPWE